MHPYSRGIRHSTRVSYQPVGHTVDCAKQPSNGECYKDQTYFFSCINVREDSKEMLKPEGEVRGFYHTLGTWRTLMIYKKNNDRSLLLPKFNDVGTFRIELKFLL